MAPKKDQPVSLIKKENLPNHVAIIMDGNGRWARKKLLPRSMGHRAGMSALKEVVKACDEFGIKVLTVFAFSTENWKRPHDEVDFLMRLLLEFLHKELRELHEQQVCIHILGDYKPLPTDCRDVIQEALKLTEDNPGLIFNIALNYGSRHEIVRAVRTLATRLMAGELETDQIDEKTISEALYTGGLPDPDLLIRTAGEMRLSNFLLWQIAYAELWVTDCLWPDFSREELARGIVAYQGRERRFGGLSQGQDG
ncbi:MAG TPA: isoprenyl transferase [Syntrophomonadaceae bacterium]|nr:isoprenyl transferase [Syntrophomonadaceae bacterium]